MFKSLYVIMDDFGKDRLTDQKILALASQGMLTGVSVIVNNQYMTKSHALLLRQCSVQIGLHICLCEFKWCTFPYYFQSWRDFVKRYPLLVLGLLMVEIKREINYQIEKFTELFDRPPDYFDSHQHLHMLPAIFSFLQKKEHFFSPIRIRSTWSTTPKKSISGFILNVLGALQRCSRDLECIGVYDVAYLTPELLRMELLRSRSSHLELIVHPDDYDFLMSSFFRHVLDDCGYKVFS